MHRLRWTLCLVGTLGVLGCGGDDDDAHGGAGTAGTLDGGSSRLNTGSGGRANTSGTGGKDSGSGGVSSGSGGLGSGSGGTGADSSSPTARTEACIEYVRGSCASWHACSAKVEQDVLFSCVWTAASACPDLLFSEGSTRTVEGTIECAQAWRDISCADRTRNIAPACASAGTLPPGAMCISRIQCASGGCSGASNMCATCHTLVGPGDACDATHDCPEGYVCPSNVCIPIEVADAGKPQPAVQLNLGDPCDRSAQGCGAKYDCQPDADGGHCVVYPQLGENCSVPHACEPGQSYCDISQKCLTFPTDGQPCGTDSWTGQVYVCADDLTCDPSVDPPLCRRRPGAGEACTGPCEQDLRCMTDGVDMTAMKCRRPRFAGESCADVGDICLPGATRCEGGVCAPVEWQGLYDSLCKP